MTHEMAALVERLNAIPGTRVELSTVPSGSTMLDVWYQGRFYVLAYISTHQMFGVDEVRDGEGFLISYQFTSKDFEPAAERLIELVEGATAARPATPDLGTNRPAEDVEQPTTRR